MAPATIPYKSAEDAAWTDRFFADREASRAVWDALVREAMRWGPVQVAATKSRVALLARTRFLWCPQAHADGHIFVRFWLPYRIDAPRVRADPLRDRWSHRVKIDALDDEVLAWFRQAYELDRDP